MSNDGLLLESKEWRIDISEYWEAHLVSSYGPLGHTISYADGFI